MHLLPALCAFWLLPLALALEEDSPLDCVPRRSVPYHRNNAHLFHEKGVFNYSTMLLREDLDLLLLGAREAVYALDLNNISQKLASTECKNYIRILHQTQDNRMFVCGTNAFDPECGYMSYADGNLTLEKKREDGKGKCPFDPFQRYASIMVEPNFVSMAQMPESHMSEEGDDDKVYLFFSETAVECDCYNKLVVSRVARVCKGDLGGQRTLQKKWTSFLKARMDCPVLESQLPYVIQDTYRSCDPHQPWKDCLFYSVFTPQSDTSDLSAVCAYRVSDISRVFAEGKYKTPVPVETSFVKWCINNAARKVGITQTLDLPDRTLQFIKDRPLMDQAIQPIGEKPVLVRKGATFTRIIVNQVQAADGEKYQEGTLLKAVNYDGEMFIIEEVQIFEPPEPIKILKFSNVTGQLYAGSDHGAAQIPLATCGRSSSCIDCVLARDPYCGWDQTLGKCLNLANSQRELIQSVKGGDASLCPHADPVKPMNLTIWLGGNRKLDCPSPSTLAKTSWEREGSPLTPSTRLQLLRDGLLILNATDSDGGRYRCLSVEPSKAHEYTTTVAEYQVSMASAESKDGRLILPQAQKDGPSVAGLQAVVGLLVVSLLALLAWNFYKGHLPLPWNCRKKNREQPQEAHEQGGLNTSVTYQDALRPALAEDKPLVSGTNNGGNNNHTGGEAAFSAAEEENDGPKVVLSSLQYIDDE
ncbi:hypothetical protein FQN60_016694 [Etheostoma spectabile]|uniref:Sema domain-containing protein n=1 Tax=Etheostoma spectabile TaxID=54343 RepID=A0A5J5CZM7_9PERO|nr:hypothetical protein FQN60_016106 [Etheostoma spectabile]KAA8587832.1 hypothetical protein FQN60_016694 [Etheostoma spectabile]